MKVSLHEDMIVSFSGDTEIGSLPKGVGLERLRWDGEKVIDLMSLAEIWVRLRNGVFTLHCVEVPQSQKISMTYLDRKRLTQEAGAIRLRIEEEVTALEAAETLRLSENGQLKSEVITFITGLTCSKIGTQIDTIFDSLTSAQKLFLKRLCYVVLFLCKRSMA